MKIALVNNFFVPRPSGSAHMTEGLAVEFARRGHDVLVVSAAYSDAPQAEVRDGYRVVRLPSRTLPRMKLTMNYDVQFAASPGNYRRLVQLLDDFQPDLVHEHGQFFDISWMATLWARRRAVPIVMTVHTALVHTRPLYAALLHAADLAVARPFIEMGKPHFVVFDKWIDGYVARRYGIPLSRREPIVIGVDPSRFDHHAAGSVREELGIGDRRMVLSLGHVIPVRNRVTLVRALPRLIRHFPDVAVVVVGNVLDDAFLREADRLGVRDRLILTGAVPKDKIPALVAACDLETHDHQGRGLGTTTLEVMAAGKPVIAAADPDNFPGITLRSWENIVLIPLEDATALADAMIRILQDPALATQLGTEQRRLILDHFTYERVAGRHLELYQHVVESSLLRAPRSSRQDEEVLP